MCLLGDAQGWDRMGVSAGAGCVELTQCLPELSQAEPAAQIPHVQEQ